MQDDLPIRDLLNLCLSSGDQQHWKEFVRRTQPMLANVIINTVRRWREPLPSLVDDFIQDTYLKLIANDYKALRSIRNEYENTIFGYLKVVAMNTVRDHFRSAENRAEEVEANDLVIPPSQDSTEQLIAQEQWEQIEARLAAFSTSETYERDMLIFRLHHKYGYTAKEISMIPAIGLTIKGVEAVLLRLMRYLRGDASASAGDE